MKLTFAAALCLIATLAAAEDFTVGPLTVGAPRAIETAATARSGAGYFTITNNGAEPDRLLAVEAAFPEVSIHETAIDSAGVARMVPVPSLEIPPGATVTLAPRGLHVMFMGLKSPLKAGETIPATLRFEKAGPVAITFTVEPRGKAGMDHDMPGMSN